MSFAPPVTTFLISVVLGLVFGAIWDCLRIIRKKIGDFKKLVFVLDIIFFVLVSALTICFFFFFTYGGIRAFALVGELLGFILFYSIFEKPIFPLIYFIMSTIIKLIYFIYKIFRFVFMKVIIFTEKILMFFSTKFLKAKKPKKPAKFNFFKFKFKNVGKLNLRKNGKNVRKSKKK